MSEDYSKNYRGVEEYHNKKEEFFITVKWLYYGGSYKIIGNNFRDFKVGYKWKMYTC